MAVLRHISILTALLIPAICFAGRDTDITSRRFNFGAALGCGSTSLYMQDIRVGDYTTKDYSRSAEVCYILDAVCRLNINKCYLQSGLSFYNCGSSVTFDVPDTNTGKDKRQSFSFSGEYLQLPITLGYNIIKQSPYCMSVFAGPKMAFPIKGKYTSHYSGFGERYNSEDIYPINMKLTLGMCFNISHLFLEFGYDFELGSQSDGIIYSTQPDSMAEVIMKRTTGILHFSVGFLF